MSSEGGARADTGQPLLENGEGNGRDNGMIAKLIGIALGIGSITAAICTFTGKLPWDPEEKDKGWSVFAWKVFFVVFIPIVLVLPYLIYHLYGSYCTTAAPDSTQLETDIETPVQTSDGQAKGKTSAETGGETSDGQI